MMMMIMIMYGGSKIWSCCLCLSSTYATLFGLAILNFSRSDLVPRPIKSSIASVWCDVVY